VVKEKGKSKRRRLLKERAPNEEKGTGKLRALQRKKTDVPEEKRTKVRQLLLFKKTEEGKEAQQAKKGKHFSDFHGESEKKNRE